MWSIQVHDVLEIIHEEGDEEYVPLEKKPRQRKQSWTEKSMTEALNCCQNQEIGIEEASIIYGIPKRSLRSRLKDKNFSVIDEKYRVFVLPAVPPQAELELAEHLQDLIQSQFTLTSVEVRRIAYELVSEKYQFNNLPKEKDCLLGNRWYKKFIAKYPHLEAEDPEASHDKSEAFYNSLESLIIGNQINSDRIFCVDGVELKYRATDSHDFDKIYNRRKIIYTDSKAICCISASGIFFPPVFIQPEDKGSNCVLSHTLVSEDEYGPQDDDCILLHSKNGKIASAYDELRDLCENDSGLLPTAEEVASIKSQIKAHLKRKIQPMTEENEEELREKLYEQFNKLRNKIISKYEDSLNNISSDMFHEWLRNFVFRTKPSCHRKVILLVGDQSYVKCLKTVQLAKANGVVFLVLPPHSIHKIHPLDGFAMSLNRNLSTCASIWLGTNLDFKIQDVPLHDLFKKAYKMTVNPTIAKNGFMYSGIWPVNRTIFESRELGGESFLLNSRLRFSSSNAAETSRTVYGIGGSANEVKAIEVGKLCRVCMKEKMYMKPLFEANQVNFYGRKISEFIKREISPNDGLPPHICQYCLVQLKDVVKTRNFAMESNEKLLKLKQALSGCFYDSKDRNENISLSHFQLRKQVNPKLLEKLLTKECDINSICRICVSEKPLLTCIFRECKAGANPSLDLCSKIATVADCQVNTEDELPSSICPFCRTSVNQAWEFIEKTVSSDKRFREILGPNVDET